MKFLRHLLALSAALAALQAQTFPTATNEAVTKVKATNNVTGDLDFGTGRTLLFESGSTLSLLGTLSGTPTGGTLNLSALTLTLPATVSGGTSSLQPLDADLTAIAALTTTANGRSLLTASALTAAGLGLTNGAALDTLGANGSAYYLNLAANHTGILPTANGGTANAFFTVSGPATSAKTFTFPNASATILTDNAAVTVAQGGTGRATSTTAYGLIAAGTTATGVQQTLATGATTDILVSGGAAALPVWTTATGSGAPVRATSPTLTGTPLAPTATTGTNTTQLATTAFVNATDATTGNLRSARGGVALDGTTSTRVYSTLTNQNIGTDGLALSATFKVPSSVAADLEVLSLSASATNTLAGSSFSIGLSASGGLTILTVNAAGLASRNLNVSGFISTYAGKVVNVVAVRSANTVSLYVNGVLQSGTDSGSGTGVNWSDSITSTYLLAGFRSSSSLYVGTIYAASFYNLALTQADVTEIYELGGAVPERFKFGNQSVANAAFTNAGYEVFTGALSTGYTAGETGSGLSYGVSLFPATTRRMGTGQQAIVSFNVTVNSGVLTAGCGLSEAGVAERTARPVVVAGANSLVLTTTAPGANSFDIATSGNVNITVSSVAIKILGAVVHLDGDSDGIGYQWKDQSTNRLDSTLTATGATFTKAQRTGTVYAALTWAGTHEAKSLLGQIALPLNAVISSIVTTASVASSGSGLTVGSVTTPALFVAANTYTTARKLHTLATAIPAGTATNDLSLVLDPDTAAYTGTIQVAVNYYTSP